MSHDTMTHKEVRIRGLGPVSPESCVLILEELGGSRLLPIFASLQDGEAIARKVAGFAPPRPLTHDLLVSTVQTLGWSFVRVVVSDVKDGAFYARIDLAKDGVERSVDSRPSDAINVALRAGCAIFVAEHVFALGESVLKPIGDDEKKKFAEDLDKLDLAQVFAELEKKPAPREAGTFGENGEPADSGTGTDGDDGTGTDEDGDSREAA